MLKVITADIHQTGTGDKNLQGNLNFREYYPLVCYGVCERVRGREGIRREGGREREGDLGVPSYQRYCF
jgi:hypothetical protein